MFLRRLLCIWITISFVATLVIPPQRAYAQTVLNLPEPGTMVNLSSAYTPVLIKGLKINPSNPLALDFIVATGDSQLTAQDPRLKKESEKLIKYFFAALTLPEKDVWVNLSPYEKDRIIPKATGETEMGRDMLAQDYILKQITASLIYPEKGLGKDFWNKIYTEAYQRFGTTQIPVNTFNKVWIVADKASVYEAKDTVFVVDSHLKVMLDEDYKALTKHQQLQPVNATHALGSQVVREIVLPALEKEVNEGKNFANLRQIFHSLILAKWYKETLKTALLNQVYSNKDKIAGVDVADKTIKEKIYQQYLQAYKKGVFNYIKEDKSLDSSSGDQPIARKYFSGGVDAAMVINHLTSTEFLSRAAKGLFLGLLLNIAVTAHAQNPSPSSTQMVISASTVELSKKDKEKLDGYLFAGLFVFSFIAAAVTASTLFAVASLKTEDSVSGPTKIYDAAMAADENESVAQMLAWDLKGYHSVDMEPFKEAIPPEYQLKAQQGISEVPPGYIGIALKAKSFDVDPETGILVPRLAVPYYGFVLAEQEMVELLHQMAAYNMPVTKRLVARIMDGRDINLGEANADLFEQQERDAAMVISKQVNIDEPEPLNYNGEGSSVTFYRDGNIRIGKLRYIRYGLGTISSVWRYGDLFILVSGSKKRFEGLPEGQLLIWSEDTGRFRAITYPEISNYVTFKSKNNSFQEKFSPVSGSSDLIANILSFEVKGDKLSLMSFPEGSFPINLKDISAYFSDKNKEYPLEPGQSTPHLVFPENSTERTFVLYRKKIYAGTVIIQRLVDKGLSYLIIPAEENSNNASPSDSFLQEKWQESNPNEWKRLFFQSSLFKTGSLFLAKTNGKIYFSNQEETTGWKVVPREIIYEDVAMKGEVNLFAARQTLLAFYDHTQANGHTARLLEWLPLEQQQRLLVHLFKRNYHGIYIAPDVSNQDLLEWLDSGFTAPMILERRVDNTTLNIEHSRTVVKNVNGNIVKELAGYLQKARAEGYFGVMSTAMEMPVVYQEGPRRGRKMSRAGPGGGGEGIFKNDLSAALREKGLGFVVTAPLFLADLVKDFPDDIYPTLDSKIDAYLKEINGSKLMDIELPLGNGTYPFSVFYYQQRGVPVIQVFDRSGNLFNTLYKEPNPDSPGGYMEAVLLPLASIEIPRQIGLQFEAYHFHDWQATLGNMLLSRMYADQEWPLGYRPARVQTMHNLEPQGRFMGQESVVAPGFYRELVNRHVIPAGSSNVVDLFALTNLDAYKGDGGGSLRDRRGGQGLEFYNNGDGQHLLIRSAEAGPADGVLFVSEGHMREALAGGKRSFGLAGMFQHLNEMGISVKGIHNGIFAKDNLPENLTALKGTEAATYGFVAPDRSLREYDDAGKAEWKRLNKLALQKKLNALYNKDFEINDKNILLGIPTRIVKQKGLNLMMQKLKINGQVKTLLEHILDQKDPKTGAKVQFVVLGTPGANDPWGAEQAKFFREFLQLHPEYKDRFVFVEKFDGVLAKQIGAGSDLFPMTSIDEPGGIANSELALLLSLGIIANRGGLNDAFEKGMTPFKLIPGYEVDGPNDVADLDSIADPKLREAVHQRQVSAQAMIEIISGFVKVFAGYRQGKTAPTAKYLGYLRMVAAYDPDWGARTDDYTNFYRSLIKRAQTHPDQHFDTAMTGVETDLENPKLMAQKIPLLAAITRTHPINFNGLMGFLTFNTQERLRRNKTNTTKKEIESGGNIGLVLDNRFADQDAVERFRPEARFEGVLVRENEFIGLLQEMARSSDKGRQAVENLVQYWLPDQAMTFRVPPKEIGLGEETQMFVPSLGKFDMIKISLGADSRPILLVGARNVYTFATLPHGDKRAVAVSIWGQALFIKDGSSIFARKIDINEGVLQLFSAPLFKASELQDAAELELGETPESWIPFDAAWAAFRGSVKGAKDFFLRIHDGKVLAGFVLPSSGSIVVSDITGTYSSIFPDKAMKVVGDDVHFANGWVSSKAQVINVLGEIRTSLVRNPYRGFRFLYDHEEENLMQGISLEFNEQGINSKVAEGNHTFVIPAKQKPEAFGVLEQIGIEIKSDAAMTALVDKKTWQEAERVTGKNRGKLLLEFEYGKQGQGDLSTFVRTAIADANTTRIRREGTDKAALATLNGGIDLNASKLDLQKTGSGIDIKFDQAMIAQFKLGNFAGILPVITGITPIANIYPLLGLKEPEKVTA